MRHEGQQRNQITARVEIVTGATGRTGQSPTCTIQRKSDGMWWDGVSAFDIAVVNIAMTEVDATNLPGVYEHQVPSGSLDFILGSDGYRAAVTNPGPNYPLLENVDIEVIDEVDTAPSTPDEGIPSETQPLADIKLQAGTTHRVTVAVSTNPPVFGKSEPYFVRFSSLDVNGVVDDLSGVVSSTITMVELGGTEDPAKSANLTAVPTLSVGGGPGGEDVYVLTVDDSSDFSIGDYLRAGSQPAGQGRIHEVVDIPDGFTIQVWASTTDIINGDQVQGVTPTGIYVGFFDLPVDNFFTGSTPTGQLQLTLETPDAVNHGGDGPLWSVASVVAWTRNYELDVNQRRFNTG